MFNWRITKYNPIYRDEFGRYNRNEWTSFSEVGKIFEDKKLTYDDYIAVEDSYVGAISKIMEDLNISSLKVTNIERRNNKFKPSQDCEFYTKEMIELYSSIQNNDFIGRREINQLSRLVLRENLWCKLNNDETMFVHFGYDYYMYIGSQKICDTAINKIRETSLFVEEFASPYDNRDE
ncbi:MAG: hypothetical protein K0Q53_2043 [Massilibacillus sp.]|jgi:hypothetical protein|nr:hypothetical protein [Massilibacillus sp.]